MEMNLCFLHMPKGKKCFFSDSQRESQFLTVNKQVNISLVVSDSEAKQCVQALHSAFFENGFLSEVEEADLVQNGSPVLVNLNGAIHGN